MYGWSDDDAMEMPFVRSRAAVLLELGHPITAADVGEACPSRTISPYLPAEDSFALMVNEMTEDGANNLVVSIVADHGRRVGQEVGASQNMRGVDSLGNGEHPNRSSALFSLAVGIKSRSERGSYTWKLASAFISHYNQMGGQHRQLRISRGVRVNGQNSIELLRDIVMDDSGRRTFFQKLYLVAALLKRLREENGWHLAGDAGGGGGVQLLRAWQSNDD